MKILIVVPTYNSQETIKFLISEIQKFNYDALIIDDGSSDKTNLICSKQNIHIIKHEKNMGVSSAMRSAFNFARKHAYTHVLAIDSDLQHDPQKITNFVDIVGDCDLVLGNRFSKIENIPSCKIASNLLGSCLFEEAFEKFINDVACGYRLFKVASFIDADFGSDYEFIYLSLTHALQNGLKIGYCEVPAIYDYKSFLSTRKVELLNLINSILRYENIDKIRDLLNRVENSVDFKLEIREVNFCGFYISRNDSYIIQADLIQSLNKYKSSKLYENSSLHSGI